MRASIPDCFLLFINTQTLVRTRCFLITSLLNCYYGALGLGLGLRLGPGPGSGSGPGPGPGPASGPGPGLGL